jgi:hypothetical protein
MHAQIVACRLRFQHLHRDDGRVLTPHRSSPAMFVFSFSILEDFAREGVTTMAVTSIAWGATLDGFV